MSAIYELSSRTGRRGGWILFSTTFRQSAAGAARQRVSPPGLVMAIWRRPIPSNAPERWRRFPRARHSEIAAGA